MKRRTVKKRRHRQNTFWGRRAYVRIIGDHSRWTTIGKIENFLDEMCVEVMASCPHDVPTDHE